MPASPSISFTLLAGGLGFFGLGFGADPLPKGPFEAETSLLKAAETAEVHGIAVSHPAAYVLSINDVNDWPKVFEVLLAGKGPVARVREFMPERIRKLTVEDGIAEKLAIRSPPPEVALLKGEFAFGFTEILDRSDFYTEAAFKGMTLTKEVKQLVLLGEKRTAWQTAWMNWQLLAAIFREAIPEVPPRFRTIRVQVREGKDVVLVLSCSSSCRWEIDVKPDGKVTGVVLCGTGAQEIELIANPVDPTLVYRASLSPQGTVRRKPGDVSFDGYTIRDRPDKKFEIRQKFEAGIKALTGQEFISFQREHHPGPKSEPYVIRPTNK